MRGRNLLIRNEVSFHFKFKSENIDIYETLLCYRLP